MPFSHNTERLARVLKPLEPVAKGMELGGRAFGAALGLRWIRTTAERCGLPPDLALGAAVSLATGAEFYCFLGEPDSGMRRFKNRIGGLINRVTKKR